MHQDQVNVVGSETLERLIDNLGDILVLHVVDLGGKEDLLSGNARVLDTGTDLGLVTVSLSTVGRVWGMTRMQNISVRTRRSKGISPKEGNDVM